MIHRAPRDREHPFVRISNEALRDGRLSFRARGLLAHLLTRPDDWVVVIAELVEHGPDGKEAVRTALRELVDHGYLVREAGRAKGRFATYDTEIYEVPGLNPHRGGKSAPVAGTHRGGKSAPVAGTHRGGFTAAVKPAPVNPPLRTTDTRTTEVTNDRTTDGGGDPRSLTRGERNGSATTTDVDEVAALAARLRVESS